MVPANPYSLGGIDLRGHSSIACARVELPVDFADKLYHCAAYGWLALLPVIGFADHRTALCAAFFMIILGALLEAGQYFVPGRMFSVLDILANALGVILGVLLGRFIGKRME